MTSKRERSVNFSREEVELLTSLVAQHKSILENKKSDAVTWNEKEQCWKTLEALFNSKSGTNYRSAKTLKAKYEGIKRNTRKKSALIRAETYRTGGGPSAAPPLTPVEEKVKDMILLSVDGIESEFDSDHVDPIQIDTVCPPPTPSTSNQLTQNIEMIIADNNCVQVDTNIEHHMTEGQSTQNDDSDEEGHSRRKISQYTTPKKVANDEKWTNWKPKSLRSKKHPALSAEKMKRPFERVADAKLEIADLQKKILEEEFLNKRKQWAFEEEEREHKREMWALEKKYFLNKFEK
ncbi:uncharacterized protein LOC124644830 isoform X1 [Helicoverpa zea]|uniref:uncharacterized protein LOC124629559 isoform X1 n=1 Tax=Helicoverpa zea TaxID=7113 RepID=UPI001F59CD65|nr:uncharacterized protein LOC124629559 isoform X1 [Helicoverpa zea]XP_047019834.1 uncharacterized protein LOC124630143 isoform X1 [Helicoverpa zea]XP_047020150.1 uncharacterized protein LOC124630333 isoform X1 [Helicoverpa zea]XP_047023391.1 uncharacterized protein LOC124632564 isoform X1 [Helicoverpa zea]XP_047026415.1 uncharacterized protein LOC124634819 isoform X1 [Helicoverpa zea]XP_047026994.1 uncharacterized protein LOC124635211 isoform X1 [Helicoverpa zea]XP_047027017.1 uncharacterize